MAHHLLLLLMVFGSSVTLSSSQCTEGKEPDVFKPEFAYHISGSDLLLCLQARMGGAAITDVCMK